MSTPSSCETDGAGPSAAIRLDGGCQTARRPAASSVATARWTRTGSGPKRAAYSDADTVLPDASSASSWPWLRTFRPKLRKTVVEESAGPRRVEWLIAATSVGGGFSRPLPTCWGGLGWGDWQAETATRKIAAAATAGNFTGR